jgi:prepilin-type N-terminal cleavage/methylation domain-containing protein
MRAGIRKPSRGYSVVEVMMAMALLGLGSVGVLAALRTVAIGGVGVRDFDAATNLAQSWADRMRADATAWISTSTFGGALMLGRGADGNAFVPSQAYGSVTVQGAADIRGADVAPNAAATRYCSALRYRCITGGAPNAACAAVVASVAVFWPREGTTAAPNPFCTADQAAAALPAGGADRSATFDNTYRAVTISTVVTPTLP